jgi:hypothetical protein
MQDRRRWDPAQPFPSRSRPSPQPIIANPREQVGSDSIVMAQRHWEPVERGPVQRLLLDQQDGVRQPSVEAPIDVRLAADGVDDLEAKCHRGGLAVAVDPISEEPLVIRWSVQPAAGEPAKVTRRVDVTLRRPRLGLAHVLEQQGECPVGALMAGIGDRRDQSRCKIDEEAGPICVKLTRAVVIEVRGRHTRPPGHLASVIVLARRRRSSAHHAGSS